MPVDSIVSKTKAAEGQVYSYSKQTRDIVGETIASARDIGLLRKNETRLNVVSALTKGDKVDHYKFRLQAAGQIGLGYSLNTGDKPIRIELLDQNSRRVLADSAAKDGDLQKAYNDLLAGEYDAKQGSYVVRVTREDVTDTTSNSSYILQLTAGTTYKADYDLTERPASNQTFARLQPASQISSILNTSTGQNLGIFNYIV